jgi:hypothetical protein
MPPDFPLLLVAPAVATDLVMRRLGSRSTFLVAAVAGTVFLLVFLAVQWPFADFLMSPWARNPVFASHRMDYAVPPAAQARFFEFNPTDDLVRGLSIALILAMVSSFFGLRWGTWMSRVRR